SGTAASSARAEVSGDADPARPGGSADPRRGTPGVPGPLHLRLPQRPPRDPPHGRVGDQPARGRAAARPGRPAVPRPPRPPPPRLGGVPAVRGTALDRSGGGTR